MIGSTFGFETIRAGGGNGARGSRHIQRHLARRVHRLQPNGTAADLRREGYPAATRVRHRKRAARGHCRFSVPRFWAPRYLTARKANHSARTGTKEAIRKINSLFLNPSRFRLVLIFETPCRARRSRCRPRASLSLIGEVCPAGRVIDVGGGTSLLAERLLVRGKSPQNVQAVANDLLVSRGMLYVCSSPGSLIQSVSTSKCLDLLLNE